MKIIVLIDEFAETRLGGLTQLDRLRKNLKKDFGRFANSICYYRENDPVDTVQSYLGTETDPIFLLKTSLVVGRNSLHALQNALSVTIHAHDDLSWRALGKRFDQSVPPMPEVEVGQPYWEILHEKKNVEHVESHLMHTLRKPSDGFTATKLNRPISLWISRRLAKLSVKPSQLTILMLILPFISAAFLVQGSYMGFLWGTFLYHLASVLDGCDGELARLKFMESKNGEWADSMADQLTNHLFLLSIGIGLARHAGFGTAEGMFYLGEGITATALMLFVVIVVAKQTRQRSGAQQFNDFGEDLFTRAPLPEPIKQIGRFISKLLRRDTYALAYFVLALMGHAVWILHFYTLGILAHVFTIAFSYGRSFLFAPSQNPGK